MNEKMDGFYFFLSVNIYSPLTGSELKDLARKVKKMQKNCFVPGLLAEIKPQINIDKIITNKKAGDTTTKKIGQPAKEEKYLMNEYFERLKKEGYTKKQIKEIARNQKLNGENLDIRKIKKGVTSADIAKEILGNPRKASTIRKASIKMKDLEARLFPPN
jgi:hypothetical protein